MLKSQSNQVGRTVEAADFIHGKTGRFKNDTHSVHLHFIVHKGDILIRDKTLGQCVTHEIWDRGVWWNTHTPREPHQSSNEARIGRFRKLGCIKSLQSHMKSEDYKGTVIACDRVYTDFSLSF